MCIKIWLAASLGGAFALSPAAVADHMNLNGTTPASLAVPTTPAGSGQPIDLKTLTRRAHAGNPHAQYALAVIYEEGRDGIKKDLAYAVSWYEEAARNGLKLATDKLHSLDPEP